MKKAFKLHNSEHNLILEKNFGLCNTETNYAFEKRFLDYIIWKPIINLEKKFLNYIIQNITEGYFGNTKFMKVKEEYIEVRKKQSTPHSNFS